MKKEAEKILIYKYLTIEIQRMWNVKTKVIPVTIGATGTISKFKNTYATYLKAQHQGTTKKNQPYWALLTYLVQM
jgi:hypothetical protein